ncbi:hypothetical protein SO802_010746 [Lithocarpus litseifolius]|uniref:DUF4283 domain-containing protein n=1 Tax=Lithocarpus litseifolius TaxID=425828 RepID=A0AAW2DGI5_9ROSI
MRASDEADGGVGLRPIDVEDDRAGGDELDRVLESLKITSLSLRFVVFSFRGWGNTVVMDELTNHCNGLSLSDREGPTFDLEEEMAMPEFIIAAKFFTRRALNMEAIASTFQPLWRSKNGFKVKNMGNHIVLFIFDNKLEVENILENEPWSFDKHLMVLQRYDKDTLVEDLQFNQTSFCVQVHGIPVRFMNQKVAEGICNKAGTVIKKSEAEGEGGSFMRVRVRVDITIPLS